MRASDSSGRQTAKVEEAIAREAIAGMARSYRCSCDAMCTAAISRREGAPTICYFAST
jgi:hypothetical protein